MNTILDHLEAWFFKRISASGFGMMRAAWGLTVCLWMLTFSQDLVWYYGEAGLVPDNLGYLLFRDEYRFTLLNSLTSAGEITTLYIGLLISALLAAIGLWPRVTVIVTSLLLFSFQERNLLPLGGGDTVLRNLGWLLIICPELKAWSIHRGFAQWRNWQQTGQLLPSLTMSIWPYRLLLWQVVLIYVYSAWEKATGTMWWSGTAVAAVYHHTHFARWPKWFMDFGSNFTVPISYYTMVYEFAWLIALVPRGVSRYFPHVFAPGSLKRALLLGGILFHGGIALMADVGVFSIAMMVAYLGLLLNEDRIAMRDTLNKFFVHKIVVLNDLRCGICQKSAFILHQLDWLKRLEIVDLRSPQAAQTLPNVPEAKLLESMHLKTSRGKVLEGYDAFAHLAWHIPPLWWSIPFWYLPGVPWVGRKVYRRVADNRTCRLS